MAWHPIAHGGDCPSLFRCGLVHDDNLGYTDDMDTSNHPWYQFSLRSLLLLTVYVAVLCSIGVGVNWFIPVIGLLALISGIAARAVSGTTFGFVHGAVCGPLVGLSFVTILGCGGVPVLFVLGVSRMPSWLIHAVVEVSMLVGVILGGIMGGLMARNPPEK